MNQNKLNYVKVIHRDYGSIKYNDVYFNKNKSMKYILCTRQFKFN